MTPLRKPVARLASVTVRDRSKRRAIVVALLPGDVIELRLHGTRRRYSLSVESAYYHAVRLEAGRLMAERKAKRKTAARG